MKPVPIRPAVSTYELLPRFGDKLQFLLLLFVRVYWGWQFFQTGSGKLSHLPKVTHYFSTLGMPFPPVTAVFIAWLELIGGILLMIGLISRLISLALFIDMMVAYIVADRAALLSFASDPGKFYAGAEYTFLFATAMVFVFGPGLFAIDTLISKMRAKPKKEVRVRSV